MIQTYLNLIKNAVYGKDVRQAIHDAIYQCYIDGRAGTKDLIARDGIEEIKSNIANPNLLINGDFQVWQRGTSFSNYANKYSADRWQIKNAVGNTSLIEKSDDVPSGEAMQQSIHIVENLEENTYLRYNFEKPLNGTYTLSFWYKSSVEFNSFIYDNNTLIHLGKVEANDEWERVVYTFDALAMTFLNVIHAIKKGDCYIAGVKLEHGTIATPFISRLYAEELELCQRYYMPLPYNISSYAGSSGLLYLCFDSKVLNMRTTPTFTGATEISLVYGGNLYTYPIVSVDCENAQSKGHAILQYTYSNPSKHAHQSMVAYFNEKSYLDAEIY